MWVSSNDSIHWTSFIGLSQCLIIFPPNDGTRSVTETSWCLWDTRRSAKSRTTWDKVALEEVPPNTSVFPCRYHSTNAPYSSICDWRCVVLGTDSVAKRALLCLSAVVTEVDLLLRYLITPSVHRPDLCSITMTVESVRHAASDRATVCCNAVGTRVSCSADVNCLDDRRFDLRCHPFYCHCFNLSSQVPTNLGETTWLEYRLFPLSCNWADLSQLSQAQFFIKWG